MQVTADFDRQDGRLALASPAAYLLITATAVEVLSLGAVAAADWTARASLQVGRALGHPVYWCAGSSPDEVNILVGRDDETWELALTIPLTAVLDAVRQASGSCRSQRRSETALRRDPGGLWWVLRLGRLPTPEFPLMLAQRAFRQYPSHFRTRRPFRPGRRTWHETLAEWLRR